jgi:hypothetical protein
MIEEDLRDLSGFTRAGGCLDNQAGMFFDFAYELMLELKYGQILPGHRKERPMRNVERPTIKVPTAAEKTLR